eukprot:899951-Pyramimonas_sp.AAC.1
MVVVAVRGTLGVTDTLCDLCCESAPLRVGTTNGRVHSGFLKAAETLDAELADKVRALVLRGRYGLSEDAPKWLLCSDPHIPRRFPRFFRFDIL